MSILSIFYLYILTKRFYYWTYTEQAHFETLSQLVQIIIPAHFLRGSIKINKKPNDTETKYYQKVLNLWDSKLYKKHQKLMILTVQFLRYAIKQDSVLINCQYHAIGFKILENPKCLL